MTPRYQIIDLLIEGFNADVAEPNVVAVVLEADIAFVILTAAVVEELECEGPFFLAELAVLEQFCPLRSPEVVFNHILTVSASELQCLCKRES